MSITIHGDVKGNVIEKIEPGNTIIGYNAQSIEFDVKNDNQMQVLIQELQNLKMSMSKEQGKEETCAKIDEAVDAIKEKNGSKLKQALLCIGRECANVVEGILGSILATLIMQG